MNTNADTTQAARKIAMSRAKLSKTVVYYSQLLYGMRPVPTPGLGTVATTKELVLLFDPAVVGNKWTDDEVTGAVLHEVLHQALRHCPRADKLEQGLGASFDRYLWNVCADFECNRIVRGLDDSAIVELRPSLGNDSDSRAPSDLGRG